MRDIIDCDFIGPGTRQVLWRAEKEDEVLMGTPVHYLPVEFERFRRGVSANVEHEEIVDMGSPQKSRCGDLFSFMHLNCVSSQDGGAHLASCLAAVDEENFLVGKSRAATQWRWAIHTTLPKRARPLWEGDLAKVCAEKERESTEISESPVGRGRFYRMMAALSKSETARTTLVFLEPFSLVA